MLPDCEPYNLEDLAHISSVGPVYYETDPAQRLITACDKLDYLRIYHFLPPRCEAFQRRRDDAAKIVRAYLDFAADDECHLPRPDLRCDDHVALTERRRLEEGQHHSHEPGHLRAVQREEPGGVGGRLCPRFAMRTYGA